MKCHCEHDRESNCITRVPIFHSLNQDEMMEVAQITRELTVQKGETIYAMDDTVESLFVIHSGSVKVYRLSDTGKEQVLRVLRAGDFLGELTLFSNVPMGDYAGTLEESSMCVIDAAPLRELMAKYPTIAFKILEELSQRLGKTEQLLEDISLHSVERRLAQALLDLSPDDGEIELPMSKRDLASQIGTTGETLSRKLSSFQELGLIDQIGQRRILIKDRQGLEGVRESG
ncbi:MAG: Crp/Fnr family transcriptional regulator [Limnochordia bacterium]|nr:Crp/Fnr family transcriptional regulator [Limnochordia bacterium]